MGLTAQQVNEGVVQRVAYPGGALTLPTWPSTPAVQTKIASVDHWPSTSNRSARICRAPLSKAMQRIKVFALLIIGMIETTTK
ncbi:hypothetical protein BDQ94DRAFT_154601 [Aspergillus welwitschiae]|uniref:Uncharacterized protein n=1 Tax=Aspergillus welwitschiae TaxID=1341132 RepID=A0A3F3PJE8_9EURO|nr:hypothetical protein BDQ94DRAFT_154601 [Aspergillus welwitschiae]RDH27065.1 hypothetical protein BDQ94DRAFT_154601 [Aspergillus welwitschiae]